MYEKNNLVLQYIYTKWTQLTLVSQWNRIFKPQKKMYFLFLYGTEYLVTANELLVCMPWLYIVWCNGMNENNTTLTLEALYVFRFFSACFCWLFVCLLYLLCVLFALSFIIKFFRFLHLQQELIPFDLNICVLKFNETMA